MSKITLSTPCYFVENGAENELRMILEAED